MLITIALHATDGSTKVFHQIFLLFRSRQDTIMYYLLTIAPWLRFVPPIWQRFQRMLAGVEFGNSEWLRFKEQDRSLT